MNTHDKLQSLLAAMEAECLRSDISVSELISLMVHTLSVVSKGGMMAPGMSAIVDKFVDDIYAFNEKEILEAAKDLN